MTWDPTWETIFRTREWGRYPPEELVRFTMRHYGDVPDRSQVRVLEVGCGTGANLWFLAREGFNAWGIDGSETAVEKAKYRIREAGGIGFQVLTGDAARLDDIVLPRAGLFDAVVDVCCLQHNRLADIQAIVDQMHAILKPGGRIFSMMAASGSWGDGTGARIEPRTYTDIPEGPAAGVGITHFSTLVEISRWFGCFGALCIEELNRSVNGPGAWWNHWVVEAMKSG